ncbi:MAG: ABC transporter transmembrane domain-containing protein, partial [Telluria sp.]
MHSDATPKAMRAQAVQAFGLLRRAAHPDRRHLGWATFWLILAAALEVAGPILGKALIDEHLLPRHLDWARMATLLGAMLVTGWLASGLRYLQLVRLSGLAMRSVQRLREWVFGHVLRLPMAFFDRAVTGQLISRVTNDTEAVKTLYIQVLFAILDSLIVLIGTMIAMAWLDWRLMLIVLALVPAVVAIVFLYQRLSAPAVTRARALRSEINGQMAESISGMSVLQANNAEARFAARFGTTNHGHYKARLAELRANAFLLRPALDFLNVVLLAVVIYSFGQREMNAIEVGVLYAFISYIARVVEPLIQITMQFSGLQQAVVASARVSALLDEAGAPEHSAGQPAAQAPVPGAPAVAIRDLTFAYAPGQDVLHQLSLDVPRGAFFGIVGHTGSGKSTLLSLLLRYYPSPPGSIEINGQRLAAIDN